MKHFTAFAGAVRRPVLAHLRSNKRHYTNAATFLAVMLVMALAADPAFAAGGGALGGTLQKALDNVKEIMTGPIAKTIGIIAVAGLGYAWLTGRMDAMRALVLVIGIGLIFGATEIIELITT